MSQFDLLFQPLNINKLTIRNRIVSTAHAEVYATDGGMTTDRYVKYYEEKAKGGCGLCICGGSSVVSIDSPQSWWSSVNLSTDRIIPHFQNLADAVHKHGGRIMIQISHMGRRSRWDGENWPNLMSPSGIREPVHRATCKTIEVEEIRRVIGDFARAAVRAKEGGLDGVELSAVHQHMIDQFWSPRVNKRTDEWGGSFENRMRFGMEVLKAVREAVGPDFVVGMRITGDEFHPDGLSHEDMKQIAAYYDGTGMVDYFGVVGSGCDTHNTLANVIPNMSYPPEPFLHLAAGIKDVVSVPVIHAQNIKDPNQAQRILEQGYVDFVGMTRAHIADPHLIAKIKLNQVDQIRQCVGANYCIDRQYMGLDVLCIQNAATSREYMGLPHSITKSDGPQRKVVVVGGGPGGMEAARVAAERGHQVTLLERGAELGGQISIAARAPQRDQMAGITRWLAMELQRLGVAIQLNTEADAATVRDLRPDVCILATGGRPFLEQNPEWGADDGRVVSSWDILTGAVEPGKNVLIYDTICEFTGMSTADYLTAKGALVELVTDDIKPGVGIGGTTFPTYYRSLYEKAVIMTSDLALEAVYREGDKLVAVLENEYTGQKEERVVDQVVVENGTRPNEELYYQLKAESRNQGQIDNEALFAAQAQPVLAETGEGMILWRLGDCVSQRNVHAAIYDALRLCKDL
ncbi:dimethylglycine demethylation protein DgcA [Serratia rhizosphaerae]|uniref:dimethylglycine demethylation protein DgcA n=1 Tax=unclassified Serratia (in: enterobacteria) TaxID=2647522 RepID=UPI000CF6A0A6|nr:MULTISPECIES: dimethylglycine demethylation protein DgcA [unclassified Serratia (in: enterobacteria)]MBU3892116.1 dimethylglycine demethylation protein DgcA [Serratia rubidaea]AVJ18536.1 N-methylproline demethylase [Serratia sp. MYb239]MCA4822713.1 dimethylglycine demethylation protein DgcA [Serratia rubidaea]QNK33965.1 dimethylglycine demethylation protein DgcA [Serratia sp. JUb9]QPT12089.1 dimethylglycine demethylation protein DgcA [Serratia rubidaea]